MITFLEGKLDTKQLGRIEMNLGGVGYEVFIPLSSYDTLPLEGDNCRILTYHHITDADQKLFGFCSEDERDMFMKLLTISGAWSEFTGEAAPAPYVVAAASDDHAEDAPAASADSGEEE